MGVFDFELCEDVQEVLVFTFARTVRIIFLNFYFRVMRVTIPFSLTQTGFNGDDGSYVILTWVGDDTGVSILSF